MIPQIPDLKGHKVVSQEEWTTARKEFLQKELALTHELDRLRAERRELPWVKVDKDYVFQGPEGDVRLAQLFNGRSQLAIQHFMLTPGSEHICAGCSFIADHADTARQHFENADLAFAVVSRAPVDQIEAARKRMGWTFPWLSSGNSEFSYDFGVAFTPEDRENGGAPYNYGKTRIQQAPDMYGISIFVQPDGGDIFHSYSTYHRGTELMMGALNWLDLAPKGRNEKTTHSWLKLRDQY